MRELTLQYVGSSTGTWRLELAETGGKKEEMVAILHHNGWSGTVASGRLASPSEEHRPIPHNVLDWAQEEERKFRKSRIYKYDMTVTSSQGKFSVTPCSGMVRKKNLEHCDEDCAEHYNSIYEFNLQEWKVYHETVHLNRNIDILDLGYWSKDGYTPPDETHRRLVRDASEKSA